MQLSPATVNTLKVIPSVLDKVIPLKTVINKSELISAPLAQQNYSVLIGIMGDAKGRIILEVTKDLLSDIAFTSYGMRLDDDMLASFLGELGNMVGGNLASGVYSLGTSFDITPPTVMYGSTTIYNITSAVKIPLQVDNRDEMTMILALEA